MSGSGLMRTLPTVVLAAALQADRRPQRCLFVRFGYWSTCWQMPKHPLCRTLVRNAPQLVGAEKGKGEGKADHPVVWAVIIPTLLLPPLTNTLTGAGLGGCDSERHGCPTCMFSSPLHIFGSQRDEPSSMSNTQPPTESWPIIRYMGCFPVSHRP